MHVAEAGAEPAGRHHSQPGNSGEKDPPQTVNGVSFQTWGAALGTHSLLSICTQLPCNLFASAVYVRIENVIKLLANTLRERAELI